MAQSPQQSKKSRKAGRGNKKPAHQRYNAEFRREKNKARKAAKIQKILAKKAARKERKEKGE